MSESSAKSSQPLASKGEKDVSEKRGRGRPRKKPQVRGVPCEKGGAGDTHRVWGSRKSPHTFTPALGTPPVQPHYPFGQHLPGAHQQQDPPGGLQSPPRAPGPGWGLSCPSPGPAEPAFADGLIKAPLAKAAQRDKMLLEPL